MSFANSDVSDIIATTIQSRSGTVANNIEDNNALLTRCRQKGKKKPISGGNVILQELSFQDNANAMYYTGYEALAIAAQDVISAASFDIKQAACAVTISGLEMLQNAGKEQMIDLMDSRVEIAEQSMANLIANGIYSDGTGTGGKQITGLQALVADAPTSGTVGGINRATWSFWQNQLWDFSVESVTASSTTIQNAMNTLYGRCARGSDVPDLILFDNVYWGYYMASLQNLQRFPANADLADLGFVTSKFMHADVVLDGGIGGNVPSSHGYFLNTNYLFYRPHRSREFVPIGDDRFSTNQDAVVRLIGWAGNMTASGARFQGVMHA
jgi:hypothetical protein